MTILRRNPFKTKPGLELRERSRCNGGVAPRPCIMYDINIIHIYNIVCDRIYYMLITVYIYIER